MGEPLRILVPVDGSDCALRAVDMAAVLAEAMGGIIDLLYVAYFDSDTDLEDEVSWLPDIATKPYRLEGEEILAKARNRVPSQVPTETHRRTGKPSEAILELAKELQVAIIAVGGRGLGVVSGFFLGSVSQAVMEEAECSVLVVK
ncbi:MAG: universal stress protein [Selenomonadaceae bacterium]|nr:universal stress protein [Selenomonadaceae bacterium]